MNKDSYIKKLLISIEEMGEIPLKRANTIVICTQPFYDKVYNDTYIKGYKYTYLELMIGVDGINPYYGSSYSGSTLGSVLPPKVLPTESTAPVYEDYYIPLAEWRDEQINKILED
jgi:hypothetical protein